MITAAGATYDKTPYVTNKIGEMEGNWGPDSIMQKAISGYTPNVAWMKFKTVNGFDMDGEGTSASTPQVAAACALWIQLYGKKFAAGWQRVEACRLALFMSASPGNGGAAYLGKGTLNVQKMLEPGLAATVEQLMLSGQIQPSPRDTVSFPLWRMLLGIGPPGSQQERMYETEAAQVVLRSTNSELVNAYENYSSGATLPPSLIARLRQVLKAEPTVSAALQARL